MRLSNDNLMQDLPLFFISMKKEDAMLAIPNAVMNQYDAVLRTREIPLPQYADYKK